MTALPADVRELLTAVVDALDVPLADRAEDDPRHARILNRRTADVRIIAAAVIKGDGIADCTRQLRGWIADSPVTYTVYVPAPAEGEGPR